MTMSTLSAIVICALVATASIAKAETPQQRCYTVGTVDVNSLPLPADKWWHQADVRGITYKQAAAIWFQLPPGTAVGVYISHVAHDGEWDWISAQVNGAIVSGWTKHSRLRCN